MITIKVKNKTNELTQTEFDSPELLFAYLREKLSPVQVFAIDEDSISGASLEKIVQSQNNPQPQLTNFQG